jgi:hypothetical protein
MSMKLNRAFSAPGTPVALLRVTGTTDALSGVVRAVKADLSEASGIDAE